MFHLAAQPLVLRSYKVPVETFSTNVLGTVHVCSRSLRDLSDVTVAVMITDRQSLRQPRMGLSISGRGSARRPRSLFC